MSSDEDEELAELRRARASRLGVAGLTVSTLRSRLLHNGGGAAGGEEDDDEGPQVEEGLDTVEEDEGEDALRAHFPASFGGARASGREAAASAAVHAATARADQYGPPRPARPPQTEAEEAAAVGLGGPEGGPLHPGVSDSEADAGPQPAPRPSEGDDPVGSGGRGAGERDEPGEDPYRLPVTHEISLEGHTKAVTALHLDASGARLLSGSHDYQLRIFDFGGMKADLRSFRSLEPAEGHPVVAVSWSPSGDAFLAVTGSPQPKVYDREGKEQGEFARGDMYIRDMKNTKGHVSGCTGGSWHPTDKGTAMTSSDDGTVRVWDMWELQQKTVIKPSLARPGRVAVTTCAYSTDGRLIGAGLMDGMLQVWDVRGKFGQSAAIGAVPVPRQQMVQKQSWTFVSTSGQLLRGAHAAGNEITCAAFSLDGHTLLSRGADEALRVWDLRKFKTPLAAFGGLHTVFGETQCCFSPDESLILTGTSAGRGEAGGALLFYDRQRLQLVRRLGMPGSVVAIQWHPRLNQILVGCGDRGGGATRVLYDPALSTRGALLCVGRKPRAANPFDFHGVSEDSIFLPNALPMYRQQFPGRGSGGGGGGAKKRAADKAAAALRTKKPDLGSAATGMGAGGQLGATGGTLLTQFVLKNQGQLRPRKDEDVRSQILRHGGKVDEFSAFTAAYQESQPKPIYAEEEPEEGEPE